MMASDAPEAACQEPRVRRRSCSRRSFSPALVSSRVHAADFSDCSGFAHDARPGLAQFWGSTEPRPSSMPMSELRAYAGQDIEAQVNNPVWHIHAGRPPAGGPRRRGCRRARSASTTSSPTSHSIPGIPEVA